MQIFEVALRNVAGAAARYDEAFAEARAGQLGVPPKHLLAQNEKRRCPQRVGHVYRHAGQVTKMRVDSLDLEEYRSQFPGSPRYDTARDPLNGHAKAASIGGALVAGNGLGQLHRFVRSFTLGELLEAAVFPEMADLQVENGLTDDAEAEMARLDDAGVHRPHRNLVDPLAGKLLERVFPLWGHRRRFDAAAVE